MLVAQRSDKSRCIAFETEKSEGPFHCPLCEYAVTLKKGPRREHHFAHKSQSECLFGKGETEIHYRIKREIYLTLKDHPACSKCEPERILEGVRPDISLYVGKTPVAIEIQKTRINIDDIIQRTIRYTNLKIHLLWILTDNNPKTFWHSGEKKHAYRIKDWEVFLHELYSGRLYYWQQEAYVKPYHFSPFRTWVHESEWYDEDGYYRQEGGYYKETKSLKNPIPFPNSCLHLAEDFILNVRRASSVNGKNIPESRLWMDEKTEWWR